MKKPRIPRGAPGTAHSKNAAKVPAATSPGHQELALTREQATLLENLQAPVAAAQERLNIGVAAILGQYGIASAQVLGLGGTPEKPLLVILVAPAEG